ncbi:MAG: hypothetical protein IKD47_02815 [Clostridia bacterium]|nr:hypothetical protein [Clostridia bacterium]
MLEYTKAAVKKTLEDLKKAWRIFRYCSQAITLAYLIYAIFAKVGNLVVNAVLLGLFVAYTAFDILTAKREKELKKTRKRVWHGYKIARLCVKAFTLGVTLYGGYAATAYVSPTGVVFTTLMLLLWMLETLLEVLVLVAENRVGLLLECLQKDWEQFTKPATAVGNFFKKITGKEVEPPREDSRAIAMLGERIAKDKEEKRRKKAEKKAAKKDCED